MANTFEYEETIEAGVVAELQAETPYTVDRLYSSYSPAALYDEAKAKMNAVNGTVLIKWQETQYDPIDTQGKMYQSEPAIELLCLWPAAAASQLPNQPRKVLELVTKVASTLIDYRITLDTEEYGFYLRRKQNLFRDTNMDAVLLTMALGGVVTEF
jgi:hypothetical protein